ncbi:non-ribosomal peptide synthetase [Kordia zhangzhouensis]|uniref:non-ribosomal peptide synthetase n=1 Tax=Kordia zhangzhouensis TaxID=1620405 RepID=UPI000629A740|nr:non-ribosomal peptide synthetase [Kordia zhangzhouensis]
MENNVISILKEGKEKGIKLVLNNGALTAKSDVAIDRDLLHKIKTNKEQIIQYLEKFQGRENSEKLVKITSHAYGATERIPLSFGQERMWLLDQLQGNSANYHIPIVLQVSGALDIAIIEKTLHTIVNRHETLRTVIYSHGGTGYQKILSSSAWSLKKAGTTSKTILEENIHQFIETPFNLSKDYMFRACIYNLSKTEHVLVLVFHHIASDGWSEKILTQEFMSIYNALIKGKRPNLSKLSLHYSDIAFWQRNIVEKQYLDKQLTYWKSNLSGVQPLELPLDYPRTSKRHTTGATISNFPIATEVYNRIHMICKEEGVTLFMFLATVFKLLLSKYSGQKDICIGTPIANRTQSELEEMIGFFVNTLALRTDLSGNPTFKELLNRVKITTLNGYDHQLAPFEKVVDTVEATRDIRTNPLFQVMFVVQNTPDASEFDLHGVKVSLLESKNTTAKFDLSLNVVENSNGISLGIEYSTALFKEDTIHNMLRHYYELLKKCTANIHQSISAIQILTKEEKNKLLYEFNATTEVFPKNKTLVDLFRTQAFKTPKAVAIMYEGNSLTYEELELASNRFANYLVANHKIEVEDFIGLKVKRNDFWIVYILGILKSGGVYIPIDPAYPKARIDYIENDSNCKLIIDEVFTVRYQQEKTKYTTTAPTISIEASSLAYIIYTSGSTGTPKGVLIQHNGIANTVLSLINAFQMKESTNCLQFANQCFDASVWEILSAILSGGSLHIIKETDKYDVRRFESYIHDHNIHITLLPPAYIKMLAIEKLQSIHTLITGGEEAPLSQVKHFQSNGGRYINAYGPTEASVCATIFEGTIMDFVPIGKPISNVEVYILDEELRLLPIGVIGELCIGGSGLARGYLNQEKLTQEKFIAHPFKTGERLYKTGDVAKWLPDGNIAFIGRKDSQVKIRGHRVELGEIENTLLKHEAISNCCVLARKDTTGSNQLVGYILETANLTVEKIELFLAAYLPDYMIPKIWGTLEEFPLTSSGKIDKKKLATTPITTFDDSEYVSPRNEIEEQLVAIWQELLGIEKIGVYDNFFNLGGQSISAMRLTGILWSTFKKEIKLKDLLIDPTINWLSVLLQTKNSEQTSLIVPLNQVHIKNSTMFMIPPVIGNPLMYMPLAQQLKTEKIACFGLQYQGEDDTENFSESIEKMAESMFLDIAPHLHKTQQNIVLGYSMSVTLAVEVVAHIETAGFPAKLILVDRPLNDSEITANTLEEKEIRKGVEETIKEYGLPEFTKERIYNLLYNNIKIVKMYDGFKGLLHSDILAVEAKENPDKNMMKSWEKISTANFSHVTVDGNHTTIFEDENIASIFKEIKTFINNN